MAKSAPKFTAKQVKKRLDDAKKRKTNWNTTYREVLTYTAPHRDNFNQTEEGSIKNRADVVFDSIGITARNRFINNIQGALFPTMSRWVSLRAGTKIPAAMKDKVNADLGLIEDVFFAAIRKSNFDSEIAETLGDVGVGTGSIKFDKGNSDNPFRFQNIPIDELFLEEGILGRADNKFREFKVPVGNAQEMWPDIKLTKDLADMVKDKPTERVTFLDYNYKVNETTYEYYVLDAKGENILVYRKQTSSPIIASRWSVVAGEIMGRGPLMFALPDIKTCNKVKEFILKNAAKEVAGVYTIVDDGIMNIENIRIEPGAKIPVTANPGSAMGASIVPLPSSGKFDVGNIIIDDLHKSINETTFGNPLGDVDAPVKTATEVAYRQQLLARQIGSAFGRICQELVTQIVKRGLFILEDLGLIDLSGMKVDGEELAIDFISPLAQAQNEEVLNQIQRYVEHISQTFGPQAALLLVNPQQYVKEAGELLNIPKEMIPTDDQFAQITKLIQQIALQQSGGNGQAQAAPPQQ